MSSTFSYPGPDGQPGQGGGGFWPPPDPSRIPYQQPPLAPIPPAAHRWGAASLVAGVVTLVLGLVAFASSGDTFFMLTFWSLAPGAAALALSGISFRLSRRAGAPASPLARLGCLTGCLGFLPTLPVVLLLLASAVIFVVVMVLWM